MIAVALPTSAITCEYSKGVLGVTVQYTHSIQGVNTQITLTPPATASTFLMSSSVLSLTVNPSNLNAVYFESSTYDQVSSVTVLMKVSLAFAVTFTILSLFISPVLGICIMSIVQVCFFSIALLQ